MLLRVLSKIRENEHGCWVWTGGTARGYGQYSIGRRGGRERRLYVHRVVFELYCGTIPAGMEIDHLCRNRSCCNPSHLEVVTHWENLRRTNAWQLAADRNRSRTNCPAGHAYDQENTYHYPDGRRSCRRCNRERMRQQPEALRAG
jgi:hypothetical protein